MEAARLVVLQHIPDFATEPLAVDFGMAAQAQPERCNAIPGRAEERTRHGSAQEAPGSQLGPFQQRSGPDLDQAAIAPKSKGKGKK